MKKLIRELQRGDKVLCTVSYPDGTIKKELLSYGGMDGGYARLYTSNGTLLNAKGKVYKVGDHYEREKK